MPPEEVRRSRKQQRTAAFPERQQRPRRAPDACTWDKGHGRLEYRELWVVPAGDLGPYLAAEWGWQDITQIRWIRRYRTAYHASDMPVQPDRPVAWSDVAVTGKQYGPVQVIAYWDAQEKKPLSLVTNLPDAARAVRHDLKRALIETFFSDQKSRGFHLDQSHLADPARLSRLLIAACLAYIWIIYLGRVAHQQGWIPLIHRTTRCDLSLFQVGLRFLQALMKRGLPIPVGFVLLDGDEP